MPEIDIVWIAAGGGAILVLLLLIVIVAAAGKKKKAQGLKGKQSSPPSRAAVAQAKPAPTANSAPAATPAAAMPTTKVTLAPVAAPTPAAPLAAKPAAPSVHSAAPATKLELRYNVDFVRSDSVAGWVTDPADASRRLDIAIHTGEGVVGKARADGFRQDLKDAGTGDGNYAFHFPLNRQLVKGERIRIVASSDRSEQVLADTVFAG